MARFDIFAEPSPLLLYSIGLLTILFLFYAERKRRNKSHINLRGCKKLGLRDYTNLSDEFSPQYANSTAISTDGKPTEPWKIKALFIHPIKSCAPVELDLAELSSTGLTWDRQFCFAEYRKPDHFPPGTPQSEKEKLCWTFRTLRQKGYEGFVKVRPEVWVPDPESVRINRIKNPNLDGLLVINYPNISHGPPFKRRLLHAAQSLHLVSRESSFHVPLLPPKSHTYPLETFSIWLDIPQALNYGRHVPADFKRYLQIPESTPFTLFRVSPSHYRTNCRNAPRKGDGDGQVPYQSIIAFADSYPLHLQNIASVRDVAKRVRKELPRFTARRFRPNIIVVGPDKPYDEDDWKRIRVHPTSTSSSSPPHLALPESEEGGRRTEPVDLHTACHTTRCKLPNVDPDTAYRHKIEPDKTLRSFRCIDSGDKNKAVLGLQLVPAKVGNDAMGGGEDQTMQLRVGDSIEVLERGELVCVKA